MIKPNSEDYNKSIYYTSYDNLLADTKVHVASPPTMDTNEPTGMSRRMRRTTPMYFNQSNGRSEAGLDIFYERDRDYICYSYGRGTESEQSRNFLRVEIGEKPNTHDGLTYFAKQELRPIDNPHNTDRLFQSCYSIRKSTNEWSEIFGAFYTEGRMTKIQYAPISIDVVPDGNLPMIYHNPEGTDPLRLSTQLNRAIFKGAQNFNLMCYGNYRILNFNLPVQLDPFAVGRIDGFFEAEHINEENGPLVSPEELGFALDIGHYG